MKESIHITLSLKRNKGNFSSFSPLLRKGFRVKAQVGNSIKHLLCDQFQVEEDYLMGRINTVFLEGKPVDDVETALVKDGSTVVLAAAMPGLVGATPCGGVGILPSFAAASLTKRKKPAETAMRREW